MVPGHHPSEALAEIEVRIHFSASEHWPFQKEPERIREDDIPQGSVTRLGEESPSFNCLLLSDDPPHDQRTANGEPCHVLPTTAGEKQGKDCQRGRQKATT
jgi:hypothetical protein